MRYIIVLLLVLLSLVFGCKNSQECVQSEKGEVLASVDGFVTFRGDQDTVQFGWLRIYQQDVRINSFPIEDGTFNATELPTRINIHFAIFDGADQFLGSDTNLVLQQCKNRIQFFVLKPPPPNLDSNMTKVTPPPHTGNISWILE